MDTIEKTVKLKDLHVDPKLTRIRHVNPVLVNKYAKCYRKGDEFPKLLVTQKTEETRYNLHRIVSGNHRYTALLEEYGKHHKIKVKVKQYNNEAEVLEDFAKENLRHGEPLRNHQRNKLIQEMVKEGMDDTQLAGIFPLSVKRIREIADGDIEVIIGNDRTNPQRMPAKKGFRPDKPISEKEYENHDRLDRGVTVTAQCSQLIRWMDKDLVGVNEENIESLKRLRESLDKWIVKKDKKVGAI